MLIMMLIFSGCTYNKKTEETTNLDNNQGEYTVLNSINDKLSDGIIEKMNTKELITKLSKLNNSMTKADIVSIFGKEPYIPIELNSNIYDYFSGEIHIRLWGDPIYQVIVEYGESSITIDLKTSEETYNHE